MCCCACLELGPLVLVQLGLQQLLGHLDLALESVLVLTRLVGFGGGLIESLPRRPGLPLPAEHHRVPELQPLEQTAVGELEE